MQPSTQVTHMPLKGLTDPSVLFFVRVAALLLIFVRLGMKLPPRYPLRFLFLNAGAAVARVVHPTLEILVMVQAGRGHGQAAVAKDRFGARALAAELAGRADVHAGPAGPALLRAHVEGCRDLPLVAPLLETDGPGVHLLGADPRAQPAEDALLVTGGEADPGDPVLGGQVLQDLGAGGHGQHELDHHPPRRPDPLGVRPDDEPLLGGIGAGGDELALQTLADLDDAEAAASERRQSLVVTERRDLEAVELGRVEEGR